MTHYKEISVDIFNKKKREKRICILFLKFSFNITKEATR